MEILILHPNFPGQFRHRIQWLASQGHNLYFVCQTHYGRSLKGVKRITLKGKLGYQYLLDQKRSSLELDQLRSQQYREGLQLLKSKGLQPDLVLSHCGWGCGVSVAEIWPNTYRVAYSEWWFKRNSALAAFNEECRWPIFLEKPEKASNKLEERNQIMLKELVNCHAIVSPTEWQKSQLPNQLRSRCTAVSDGVDTRRFKPSADNRVQDIITYGTRGMEVIRGFPELILELKSVAQVYPNLKIEIAGSDEICYAGKPPREGSWGNWARKLIRKSGISEQVEFIGRLDYADYADWLRRSRFHVHLTQPFICSWSLIEAMASGCNLIASDVEPVREFLDHSHAILIDHRKPGWLLNALNEADSNSSQEHSRRSRVRTAAKNYSREKADILWKTVLRC